MDLLKIGICWPADAAAQARAAEAGGYDGLLFADSQSMMGDPYVAMTLAAGATTTLHVGTGVTNPLTRHPAVTAAAISTIHALSGGRAILGIGRGDSALAYLGMAPVPVARFAENLGQLQLLLRGEDVPFAPSETGEIALGTRPSGGRLKWLEGAPSKVPLQVFATGPKVITAAAERGAERITFVVGAELERVEWAVKVARDAGVQGSLGAMVKLAPHPDVAVARDLVRGGVATAARFASMQGSPTGPVKEEDRTVYEGIRRSYDMTHHGETNTAQTAIVPDDFLDRYAVVGSADTCIERLLGLVDLGLDHLVLMPPVFLSGSDFEQSTKSIEQEIIPALKAAAPSNAAANGGAL
jgi:5,10-methylenetetrahydromethanopterin reductase